MENRLCLGVLVGRQRFRTPLKFSTIGNSGLRCFGIAGNFIGFGNFDLGQLWYPAKAGSASISSTATLPAYPACAGYGAGHYASLAADMHGDTATAAAAKP